ncbi:signal peptidase I [Alphaproteobacteria bacterium]|jgi:signal peptidase I|nr:signal peptidase I [Alphaproteobacteria bacterium]MDB2584118.1 signal peptidase I [Alphaproteobacteria bacterium]MDB2683945.1 signal peptidase I [Alphaproteobacteria bacterium]MDC0970393.1 signal peptidase I [Alphaproteobacteria bacterium]
MNVNKSKSNNSIKELFKTLLIAGSIAIFFRSIFFEPFNIPSGSMIPSLLVGDYLFVSKYSYGYSKYSFPFGVVPITDRIFEKSPKRGDIIVFRKPGDETIDYIKRLVALPNDTVQVKNGVLYINKKMVERTKSNVGVMKNNFGDEKIFTQYKETFDGLNFHEIIEASDQDLFDDTIEFKVPDNHFFFMGDNRDNSRDSRSPEVGFVPKRNLIGKAQIIFFSHNSSASIFEFWKWHKAIRFSRIGKAIE